MTSEPLKLSLVDNSHAFLRESVRNALAATNDTRQWQFAILHLVQSLELSLKAALSQIHPVLVFEDIDNPKRLVAPLAAIQRLANPQIGRMTFSDKDVKRIRSAVDIRNKITHSDFELSAEHAAAKYFEIFAFVTEFQHCHLGARVPDLVGASEFDNLLRIRKMLEELIARARARIAQEGISEDSVWECPDCGGDTFVTYDATDTCYACSHSEPVVECPQCGQLNFEASLESFVDALDIEEDEGLAFVHNSYGYSDYRACSECLPAVRQRIRDQRDREYYDWLEMEYHARSQR